MMTDKEPKQQTFEKWKPTVGWFHIFRTMIESGDAAEMKGTCFLVYAVIKAHINPKDGIGFPSLATIAHKAGCSEKTVSNSLNTLEGLGYLRRKNRMGQSSAYTLVEKVHFDGMDNEGKMVPMEASFDYIPMAISRAVKDIRNVMVSGVLPEGSNVIIENLSINVQVLPAATTANQFNLADVKDKDLREQIMRVMKMKTDPTPDD